MSLRRTASSSDGGEFRKFEQLWREFVMKVTNVILNSRICWPIGTQKRKGSKWFNFDADEAEEVTNALDKCDFLTTGSHFILEVFAQNVNKEDGNKKILLERWSMRCEESKDINTISLGSGLASGYKKAIILIRSVYSYVLLMPAYKAYRKLQRNRLSKMRISFAISPAPSNLEFEDGSPQSFVFSAVETPFGNIHLSVLYREDCPHEVIAAAEPIMQNNRIIDLYYSPDVKPPAPIAQSLPTSTRNRDASPSSDLPPFAPTKRRHSTSGGSVPGTNMTDSAASLNKNNNNDGYNSTETAEPPFPKQVSPRIMQNQFQRSSPNDLPPPHPSYNDSLHQVVRQRRSTVHDSHASEEDRRRGTMPVRIPPSADSSRSTTPFGTTPPFSRTPHSGGGSYDSQSNYTSSGGSSHSPSPPFSISSGQQMIPYHQQQFQPGSLGSSTSRRSSSSKLSQSPESFKFSFSPFKDSPLTSYPLIRQHSVVSAPKPGSSLEFYYNNNSNNGNGSLSIGSNSGGGSLITKELVRTNSSENLSKDSLLSALLPSNNSSNSAVATTGTPPSMNLVRHSYDSNIFMTGKITTNNNHSNGSTVPAALPAGNQQQQHQDNQQFEIRKYSSSLNSSNSISASIRSNQRRNSGNNSDSMQSLRRSDISNKMDGGGSEAEPPALWAMEEENNLPFASAAAEDEDEEIGSFVKHIQSAPPLRSFSSMTNSEFMSKSAASFVDDFARLQRVKEDMQSMSIMDKQGGRGGGVHQQQQHSSGSVNNNNNNNLSLSSTFGSDSALQSFRSNQQL